MRNLWKYDMYRRQRKCRKTPVFSDSLQIVMENPKYDTNYLSFAFINNGNEGTLAVEKY